MKNKTKQNIIVFMVYKKGMQGKVNEIKYSLSIPNSLTNNENFNKVFYQIANSRLISFIYVTQ